MRASVLRVLTIGRLDTSLAAALREAGVAADELAGASWLSIAHAIREARPQLVWAREAHWKASLVAKAAGIPAVLEAAADTEGSIGHAARISARTLCAGAATRDLLLAHGAPPARTAVMRALLSGDAPHRAGPLPEGPRWVVCAAPVDEPDRGVNDLLLAFLSIARARPSARLLLTGRGAGARVISQAEAAGLRGRVSWLPCTPAQLPQVFANSAVVVAPARTPAYADAVPEAMMSGAAIVATSVGPHPAWLREGRTGFLVPPKAPVALAARLANVLDDAPLARRVGQEARKTALDASTLRVRAQELERCFSSVLRPLSSIGTTVLQPARRMA